MESLIHLTIIAYLVQVRMGHACALKMIKNWFINDMLVIYDFFLHQDQENLQVKDEACEGKNHQLEAVLPCHQPLQIQIR